jgi:hypothetical protein
VIGLNVIVTDGGSLLIVMLIGNLNLIQPSGIATSVIVPSGAVDVMVIALGGATLWAPERHATVPIRPNVTRTAAQARRFFNIGLLRNRRWAICPSTDIREDARIR